MENNFKNTHKIGFKTFLLVGLLGTLITGIGEFLLHFNAGGYSDEIGMVENVSLASASIGHFMVVIGFPLYFAGYYAIFRILEPVNQKLARAFFVLGVYSFAIGGVWVASRYFIADVLQTTSGTDVHDYFYDSYEKHYQNLVWLLRILILLVSITFVALTMKGKSQLPKSIAFFNPLGALLLVFLVFAALPSVGKYIVPTAMNVAHLIFFGAILLKVQNLK